MLKFLIRTIAGVLCAFSLSACVIIPPSEYNASGGYDDDTSASRVVLPFGTYDVLEWDTGVGRGTMKVVSKRNGKFTLKQYNVLNKSVDYVLLTGEIFEDGSCEIKNPSWNEIWNGNVFGNSIVGKVNGSIDFKIIWKAPHYISQTFPKASKLPFTKGDVLKWDSGNRNGKLKVVEMHGDNFTVEKSDNFDRKGGVLRMSGGLSKDGTFKMQSASKKEIWCGKLSGNTITGKCNNGYNFKISRSNFVSDLPFKQGQTLNFTKGFDKGTIKVASASSSGKFVFDIYVGRAKYLRSARLNGQILADGTYKLIDDKSGAVWLGKIDGNKLSEKIDNKTKFTVNFAK